MPSKDLMAILIDSRKEHAPNLQKILTFWGCLIKTRLGIHDGVLDNCSDCGLIILELVGNMDKQEEFAGRLNALPGVKAQHIHLSLEE